MVSESCRVGGCCVEALVSGAVVSGSVVLRWLALSSTMCYGEGRINDAFSLGVDFFEGIRNGRNNVQIGWS